MIINISKNILWAGSIGLLIIAVLAITVILNTGNEDQSSWSGTVNTTSLNANESNSLGSNTNSSRQQTATMGAVTVDVEPITLGVAEAENFFSVAFNTHSVELDFNFTEIITMEDDLGNTYKALEWTGNSGWHHVSGDIIFPQLDGQASRVTLSITSIEDTTSAFQWDVDK